MWRVIFTANIRSGIRQRFNKWWPALLLVTGCASTAVDRKPAVVSAMSFAQPEAVIAPQGFITVIPKDVGLEWNPSVPTNDVVVTGYNLYYGTESRFDDDGTWMNSYPNVTHLGDVTNTVALSLKGAVTYYFAVTAVSEIGVESDLSDEITYKTRLDLDVSFVFNEPVTDIVVQSSEDLFQWQDCLSTSSNGVFRVIPGFPSGSMFYRASGKSP